MGGGERAQLVAGPGLVLADQPPQPQRDQLRIDRIELADRDVGGIVDRAGALDDRDALFVEVFVERLVEFGEIAERRDRRLALGHALAERAEIGVELPRARLVVAQHVDQQPRPSVIDVDQIARHPRSPAEQQLFDRQVAAQDQTIGAEQGGLAHGPRTVGSEIGGRHEFGEAFDVPGRIGVGEIAEHEVVGIFVLEHGIAAQIELVGALGAVGHGEAAVFGGAVEPGDRAALVVGQAGDAVRAGQHIDRQAQRLFVDLAAGQAAQHRVEFLQLDGELLELVAIARAVDREVLGLGLEPFFRRCGGLRNQRGQPREDRRQQFPPRHCPHPPVTVRFCRVCGVSASGSGNSVKRNCTDRCRPPRAPPAGTAAGPASRG